MTRPPARAGRRGRAARPAAHLTPRLSARAGFTLVEVLMAVTLLAVGLLAIAGLGATAARAVRGGGAQTRAAAVAQSRLDSLASVPCARIVAAIPAGQTAVVGTATTRGVTEQWTARMENNGQTVRVTDALTVPGRAAAYHYVSVRACR